MNRAIKFCGKTPQGEWAYGDLIHKKIAGKLCFFILCDCKEYEVIPEPSVSSPDFLAKNGKEIYAGNILIPDGDNRYYTRMVVVYNQDNCRFVLRFVSQLQEKYCNDYELSRDAIHKHRYNVIGNIHDNPELLTQK
jgi:hypothetical protein